MNAKERAEIIREGKEAAEQSAAWAEGASQATQAATGPAKLTEQEIDLFKAVEAELQTLRRRLNHLEEGHRPFNAMLERWFNQELERRLGMSLGPNKPSHLKDTGCEVSPMEVLRFRYNIGA